MPDMSRSRAAGLHDGRPAKTASSGRRRGPRSQSQEDGPPSPADGRQRYRMLVEKDGLCFRVLCRAMPGLPGPEAAAMAKRTDALADSFRAAFNDVWGRVPEPDRATLLAHWREQRPTLLRHHPCPLRAHCPRIWLVQRRRRSSTLPLFCQSGAVLHIPAEQTAGRAGRR